MARGLDLGEGHNTAIYNGDHICSRLVWHLYWMGQAKPASNRQRTREAIENRANVNRSCAAQVTPP